MVDKVGILDAFVIILDACCIWGCDIALMTFKVYGSYGTIMWLTGQYFSVIKYFHLSLIGLLLSLFYFSLRLNGVINKGGIVDE